MVEYAPETTRVVCCGIVNRGAALYQGRLFRVTLDARVIALDGKTGKEIWSTRFGDPKLGVSGTGAPLLAKGVVIIVLDARREHSVVERKFSLTKTTAGNAEGSHCVPHTN